MVRRVSGAGDADDGTGIRGAINGAVAGSAPRANGGATGCDALAGGGAPGMAVPA
jgi:hypothetical protein